MHFVTHFCISFTTYSGCEKRTTGAKSQSRDSIPVCIYAWTVGYCRIRTNHRQQAARAWFQAIESTELARYIGRLRKSSPSLVLAIARNRPSSEDDRRFDRFDDDHAFNFRPS